jgi:hypothetical protein
MAAFEVITYGRFWVIAEGKHAFFSNPLRPSYGSVVLPKEHPQLIPQLKWLNFEGGPTEIGYSYEL